MSNSISIKNLTPSHAIHPGEILLDELTSRRMSQSDFANLTGYNVTQLNEVIKGKRNITSELALLISSALNIDVSFWTNLQSNYDLDKVKVQQKLQKRLKALDTWNLIKDYVPTLFYKREKIITGDPVEDLITIKEIYQINHYDEIVNKYSEPRYALHRKSGKLSIDKINLIGWEQLVTFKSKLEMVDIFNFDTQEDLVAELKSVFAKNKLTVEHSKRILHSYGIKLVIQQNPSSCAIDGISFWHEKNPVIGLSLRHKRLDYFAFTLLHELGHIYLHLKNDRKAQFIDIEKENLDNSLEIEANEFSLDQMIKKEEWENFVADYIRPSDDDFIRFAKKVKVNPAMVLGRYCHQKNKYNLRTSIDKSLK